MAIRKIALFVSCLSICLSLSASAAFSESGETVEQFLSRYYTSLHKAKSLEDIKPFFIVKKEEEKPDINPEMFKMVEELALSVVRGEPEKVKIISKKEEPNGRVRLELAPDKVPPEHLSKSGEPGFSMTGSVVLVKDNGEWKVHKDYWTVKSKDSNLGFGKDPDHEHEHEHEKTAAKGEDTDVQKSSSADAAKSSSEDAAKSSGGHPIR